MRKLGQSASRRIGNHTYTAELNGSWVDVYMDGVWVGDGRWNSVLSVIEDRSTVLSEEIYQELEYALEEIYDDLGY